MSDTWLIGAGVVLCGSSVILILSLVLSLIWSVEREYAVAESPERPRRSVAVPRSVDAPAVSLVRAVGYARNAAVIALLGSALAYAVFTISNELK